MTKRERLVEILDDLKNPRNTMGGPVTKTTQLEVAVAIIEYLLDPDLV